MTADPSRFAPRTWVTVGRIRGGFGVHGALKVEPIAAIDSSVLLGSTRWHLVDEDPAGAGRHGPRQQPLELPAQVTVASLKVQGDHLLVTLQEPLSREQAQALKGIAVQVDRAEFPEPGDGEYYWADLIGCSVVDPAGLALGTVEAVDDHGAQSLLRLDNGILIPFVAAFVLDVQLAQRRITADWAADWS